MRLVIKLAGALFDDPSTLASIARQIATLEQEGHELLVSTAAARYSPPRSSAWVSRAALSADCV